jgi:hypothetical protein
MELPAKLIADLVSRRRSENEIHFYLKPILEIGILHWQEFGDLSFQELVDRAQALNAQREDPIEAD